MENSKSITPLDEYEFKFSDEMKQFVEMEFRETNEIRKFAIRSLRDWAEKNPRINKLRLDSKFLLRYLRARKFSLPMVVDVIERALALHFYSPDGVKVFDKMDVMLPAMQEFLDAGMVFALPQRDRLGRRIIFYRVEKFNPSTQINYDLLKLIAMVYDAMLEDEETQINGVVHVVDCSGLAFNYLTTFTPREGFKIGKNLEKIIPMRHKEIHILKVHPTVKFAIDFAISQASKKMKKRFFVHRKVEDVKSVIDNKLLPAEYGGSMPISEMVELFKKEMEAKREIILMNNQISLNKQLYPQSILAGSVRSLEKSVEEVAEKIESTDFARGVQGSFRKLEID